jgi:cytochrome c55X
MPATRVRALAAMLTAIAAGASAAGSLESPPPARAKELIALLRQDCGSCHGMRLTGGLGPALTPHALADKPPEALVATIIYGRAGTPMPPWGRFMSEREARWLVAQMIEGHVDAR